MKIKVHFCVFILPTDIGAIENYLTDNAINFQEKPFLDNRIIVSFDVFEADNKYNDIVNFFSKYKPIITKSSHYTKRELDDAKWLSVLCYWDKVDIPTENAYDSTFSIVCENCKAKKQIDYYKIGSSVKWQKHKNFCATSDGRWDTLFCSEYAKQVLDSNGIKGITFSPVLNYKTLEPISDIYQLCIDVVKDPFNLNIVPKPEINICDICGEIKYKLSDYLAVLSFDVDLVDHNVDIFVIPVNIAGYCLVVVSNKLYKILKYVLKDSTLDFKPFKEMHDQSDDFMIGAK